MKSNPRYVVRRAATPEPLWWIIDLHDRYGDIECRTRREAREKCRRMNVGGLHPADPRDTAIVKEPIHE